MTQKDKQAHHWTCGLKRVGGGGKENPLPQLKLRGAISRPSGRKAADSKLPRKTSMGIQNRDRTVNRHR